MAIETILVGWLSYWLFLVYANNPSVAAELGSSLQRFPQLSFSTIDIAVMVIIAALAVTLAFKFQRGLRPGIRLERALQMLENLMKRNLVLEAQVAELKIEKSHTPLITHVPISPVAPGEPKEGSWEKAFRTPLEAGPPITSRGSGIGKDDIPFGRETGIPPPRIEPKPQPNQAMMKRSIMITDKGTDVATPPPVIISEKPGERPSLQSSQKPTSSSWEDNPQFIGESKGILTPSAPPRKVPIVSDSGGLRQPYIPAPAPKPTPPSVVVGPMTSQSPPRLAVPSTLPKITARPTPRASSPKTSAQPAIPAPATTAPLEISTDLAIPRLQISPPDKPAEGSMSPTGTDVSPPKSDEQTERMDEKTSSKTLQPTRKKLSSDEN